MFNLGVFAVFLLCDTIVGFGCVARGLLALVVTVLTAVGVA
jgi:hypothetical protein